MTVPLRAVGPGGSAGPPDAEIVQRVLGGDTAAFEILMRRHNARVYRAIRAVLPSEADVEDAMQQAYLQAYAHLGEFQGAAAFSTWLVRIALNEAFARRRKQDRLVAVDELPEVEMKEDAPMSISQRTPEESAASREALAILERAIDKLPVHSRTVYMLREIEQMSTDEVARSLDVTEDVIKVRLHRARLALREILAEEVGQAAADAFPFLAPRCDRVVAAVMSKIASSPGSR